MGERRQTIKPFNPVLSAPVRIEKQETKVTTQTSATPAVNGHFSMSEGDSGLNRPAASNSIVSALPAHKDAGPTPKQMRRIYGLLEEHFDASAGQYRDNWSDQSIARAAEASATEVTEIREEAYGPLRDRFAGAREELFKLLAAFREIGTHLAEVERRLYED